MSRLSILFALCAFAVFAQSQLTAQPISSYPYTEDFSTATGTTLPTGWTQSAADQRDWTALTGSTPSTDTGPDADHTTGSGVYIYFETSSPAVVGDQAIANSPQFDYAGLSLPLLEFWYHMFGATMGQMHIDLTEQFNSGTNGSNTGTTFSSATATFTSAHIGSSIVIVGGANAGTYAIASVTSATVVELGTAPPSNLTGMTFVHQLFTADIISPFTDNINLWQFQSINLGTVLVGNGAEALFQFHIRGVCGSSFTGDMAFDDLTVYDTPNADVGVISLDAPVSGGGLTATETVTVTIENFGLVAQSNFPVAYSVNGGTPVVQNFTGTIAPAATAQFTFSTNADLSAEGAYAFSIETQLTGDGRPSNDSLDVTIFHSINTLPYFEDFESGQNGWSTTGTSSWAFGTPAKAVINSAASGTNCWVTGLTAPYTDLEQGEVVGPAFDFSALTEDPYVSLEVWWNAEFSWDGMNLQSSIDGGQSWQNVGAFGDPNNWYTDNTIAGIPGGSQEGWTGRDSTANGSGGWVTAIHRLTGLAGQSSVAFRLTFGTDGSVVDDGVAFDDFWIGDFQDISVRRGATLVPSLGVDSTDILDTGSNLTYTIDNLGDVDLALTDASATDYVQVTAGTNVASVTVTTQPTTPIAGGGSSTFVINVVPTAAGPYDFTVSIENDDFDPTVQVDSGTDGVLVVATSTFTSATAAFNATHVGATITITGSANGNDGSYTIATVNSSTSVDFTTAPAGTDESGLAWSETGSESPYVFTVSGNAVAGVAPLFTSAAPPATATVGVLYTHTFVASGAPAATLSATGVPAWLTFTPATGVLSGTPAAGDVGTTGVITITAANGVSPDATEVFSIVVSAGGGGGGGGDDGGGDDGGCSTGASGGAWLALFALLGLLAIMARLPKSRA